MKGRIITDIGQVSVDTDVIAKYAGMAAVECFGVVGMAMISVKAVSYTHLTLPTINPV